MARLPFTPAIYEHAARMIGQSPWNVSRDPELLFSGHQAAFLEYQHTPVVVGIDIYNLEAEAYGAVIAAPQGNGIPAIHRPPCETLDQALRLQPFDPQRDGRIPMTLEVAQRLARALPDADVRIPVAGPFSIAFNLLGINDLCLDTVLRPDQTAQLLMRLAENQGRLCQAAMDAGLDIAFFESAAAPPILSPTQFHDLELPALKRAIAVAESIVGHPVPCIMGGDTFPIVEDILSTGTGFVICNVETDQKAFVEKTCRMRPDVNIRVNMDPGIVTGDDFARIDHEIDRILAFTAGRSNCLLGTGALPYETPPTNVRHIQDYLQS